MFDNFIGIQTGKTSAITVREADVGSPLNHHSSIVLRGFRGASLCRETTGSWTANFSFFHLVVLLNVKWASPRTLKLP